MAISMTNLTSGASYTGSLITSVNTASVTLANGKSYLMWVSWNRQNVTPSCTGWTSVRHYWIGSNVGIELFRRDGDGSTAVQTINYSGAGAQYGVAWGIVEITGAASGASLVVQTGVNFSNGSTTPTATLAAFADGTNNAAMLGVICDLTGSHCTVGATYTAVVDQLCGGGSGTLFSQYKIGQDLNPACTSPNVEWAAVAVEVAVASSASQWGQQLNDTWNRVVQQNR